MADATDTTRTPVIPFPFDRARKPDMLHHAIDDWNQARNTALAVCAFRGMNDGDAVATVRKMIFEEGTHSVAYMLEETGRAIKSMRHIADELAGIDAMISAAADKVLAESGL
jgi:hypothetical protein